jgi:EpsI family protein
MTFRDRPIGEVEPPPVTPDQRAPAAATWVAGVAVAALVLVAVAPVYAALEVNRIPTPSQIALDPPRVGNGWRLLPDYRDDWQPSFATADKTLLRSFVKDGRAVHLFIAYYRTQHDDAEVVKYDNYIADGKNWLRVGSGTFEAKVDGAPLPVEYTRMLRGRGGRLAWSWYWVADRFTADPYRSKLYQAIAKLFGGTKAAAVVAIAADYEENPSGAVPILQDFLASMEPLRPLLARAVAK